jgi:beta-lactamase regulating signal transducer with metallopeptidase domain
MVSQHKSSPSVFTELFLFMVGCVILVSLCGWVLTWCMNAAFPIKQMVLIAGVAGLGLLILIVQAWRTWRCTSQVMQYAQIPLPLEFRTQVIVFGLDPNQLVFIQSPQPIVFCFGFLRPRICLSTGLLELLSRTQVNAALMHEEYHRQRFDPLRLLLIEAVTGALFFLPIVREWRSITQIRLELAADRYAVQQTNKAALAGALHRLLTCGSVTTPISKVAVAGLNANAARVAALLGERAAAQQVSARSVVYTTVVLWVLCLILMV